MEDESHSDHLLQPMMNELPQPLQFAHGSERSELFRADAEGSGSILKCDGDGKNQRLDDRAEKVVELRRRAAPKRKPGRPPKPKEKEEELCFICFDGGDLVVCDHRNCPKVYHPACVNRDDAYFKAKCQWTCGWHICSNCQKSAHYMCYTCTYSLCKRCISIQDTGFACVRGIKGFCETCMKMVVTIETNKCTDETTDFDDKNSWLSLFKDYWVDLKAKFSLTLEELTRASSSKEPHALFHLESSDKSASHEMKLLSNKSSSHSGEREKGRKRFRNMVDGDVAAKEEGAPAIEDNDWASKELLEFVAHMKNGDTSFLSQYDVLKLLLAYIKKHNLLDLPEKKQVICDSRLHNLFGRSGFGHLEMVKLLDSHFLAKEASPLVADDNQGVVGQDPDSTQMDADGDSDASRKITSDLKWKSCGAVEEKEPIKLDGYAAIDVHNVSLMYLRRNLMEELLDDIDNFSSNIIGSFVRIRISGSCQNKDMYRLVQIVGTGKAAEKYEISKNMTDITLQILNLKEKEFITIDVISNQDFTEEECRRLRQSVKCGFIDRLTVAEVQDKARVLQSAQVNYWLKNEKSWLSSLLDLASEKGRIKERKEYVEKLQLLSMPEERVRRLQEVYEIHVDPQMDPIHESAEEDVMVKLQEESLANEANLISQAISSPTPKMELKTTFVGSGSLNSAQPSIIPGEPSGNPPRAAPQPLSANTVSTYSSETEQLWHYHDPSGKTQGPFSMARLRKWNSDGLFPSAVRIWRTSEKHEDSILLIDALKGKFLKDLLLHDPQSSTKSPTGVVLTVNSKVNDSDGVARGSNNPETAVIISSNNCNVSKPDSLTAQQSANIVDGRPATSSTGWESSVNANTLSWQTEAHNTLRPMAPFSRNSSQPPNYHNRDGQREHNSRWDRNRGRQNNWASNRPRRFQHNNEGSERQHPCRSSSSQQIPIEQWRPHPANICLSNVVNSAANIYPNQIGGGSNGLSVNLPQQLDMGRRMFPPGFMNMAWRASPNMNMGRGLPDQLPMNASVGLAPPQGNNLAWGAQMQTNPNAGLLMPTSVMQGAGSMNNISVAWDPSGGGNPHTLAGQQQQAGDGQSSQGGGRFHCNSAGG